MATVEGGRAVSQVDYTSATEEQLVAAAKRFHDIQNSAPDPKTRAFAGQEYDRIGGELQRRSPIEVIPDTDVPATFLDPRGGRELPQGDPGPPLEQPQGLLSGERYSPENRYGKSDLKADAQRVAGALSPGTGMVLDKLKGDEAAARAEVAGYVGQAPAPQGVNIDELRAAEQALVGTGGGTEYGVSTTQGGTHQTERKVLPKEWYQALDRYTANATEAAVGGTAASSALLEAQRRSAEGRRQVNSDYRQAVEESALREATAVSSARRRIGAAMEAYRASGPKYESVGTVLRDAPGGKGVVGGIGLIMGIIGGAATNQANGFTEAVTQNIERRAKIAELESERAGRIVGMEGDQYRRLDQELGDARATRAMVRALYLEDFKSQLEEQAARVGIMSGDSRLAGLLAQIEQARMGYLEKAASVVMDQARSEQTVTPMQSKGGKGGVEAALADYTEERRKRGMDVMEGGIRLMQNGVQQIEATKPNAAQSLLFRQVLADPGAWATLSSVAGQLSPGQQAFINGFLQFLTSDAGKALTKDERAGIASAAGRGDVPGLQEMVRNFQTRYDALDRGLIPQYGDAAKLYRLRQQIHDAENPRKLYDVRGVETQPPVTERPPVHGGS